MMNQKENGLSQSRAVKAQRREMLIAMENRYPGIEAFQRQRSILLLIAFVFRVAINLASVFVSAFVGNTAYSGSIVISLFVAWFFYIAMTNGNWKPSILLFVWAVLALLDVVPILLHFGSYLLWFQLFIAVELLGGLYFFGLGVWLCCLRQNREWADLYHQGIKSFTGIGGGPQGEQLVLPVERPYFAHDPDDTRKRKVYFTAQWQGHTLTVDNAAKETRLIVDGYVHSVFKSLVLPSNGIGLCTTIDGVPVVATLKMVFRPKIKFYADGQIVA